MFYTLFVPIVQRDRTRPCEGRNAGSSPAGGKIITSNTMFLEEWGSHFFVSLIVSKGSMIVIYDKRQIIR